MDLCSCPAICFGSVVQQHLHEANHPGILDLDTGDLGLAHLYWKRQSLKKREVHVDIEILSLGSDEPIGDNHERLSYLWEVVEAFVKSEIGEIIAAQLCSQESRELLILLQESILEIRSKNVMSVFDLFQGGL